ncbi:MAG: MbnP family protein [Saprospiraceae bacterium]|nr:MbnP family protein [Saprospiraceae bacterium]
MRNSSGMGKKWNNGMMECWNVGMLEFGVIMRWYNSFKSPHPLILCLLLALNLNLTSCYEPKEGCLDINATNFAVDADNACNNCCEYPILKLAFLHKLNNNSENNLNYNDSIYLDGAGNSFRLKNIQFFISNVRLVRPDGTEVYPSDAIEVEITESGTKKDTILANNFAIVSRNIFNASAIGTFANGGSFSKIRFTLGLGDLSNQIIPTSLPAGHPLRTTGMYVNADSGYVFNSLEWYNGASDTTTTLLKIATESYLREVELPLMPPEVSILEGFDIRVTLRINYLTWFSDVNLKTDAPATLATKFVNNAANSIAVISVLPEE